MLNRVGPISILHVIALSMTMIGLKNHVTILPPILSHGGRDGWMSVIFSAILLFPWLFLLIYIHHQSKQKNIREWLLETVGPRFGKVFVYFISGFLILLSAFSLREALQWMRTTFLPTTSVLVLLIIFTVLCILLASSNIQTIAILNILVLFGVLVLGFFIAFVNIPVKDHYLLLPLLENGIEPVVKASIYPAAGYVEIILLLFIQQHFKEKMKWYHLGILLFLLMGLTMGPLIGAISEFGPKEAAKQMYPAYEEWGLARIGQFIEHIDFFSIYQWLTGAFIRVGLILFIVVELLDIKQQKKKIWLVIAPIFMVLSIGLIWISDQLFLKLKGNYFLIITFVFFFVLAFVFAWIAYRNKKKRKKEDKQEKIGRRRRAKSNRKEQETI